MRGCPKKGIWSAPVVIGMWYVRRMRGVSKEGYLERPRGDWYVRMRCAEWWSAPVVIGSGAVECKGAQSGPVAIGSRKSVWRPRGDW